MKTFTFVHRYTGTSYAAEATSARQAQEAIAEREGIFPHNLMELDAARRAGIISHPRKATA